MAPKRPSKSNNDDDDSQSGSASEVEVEETSPPPKRPRRSTAASSKTDNTADLERLKKLEAQMARFNKAKNELAALQAKLGTEKSRTASKQILDEESAESEEDQNPVPRPSSIREIATYTAPDPPQPKKLRRVGPAAPKPTPSIRSTALKNLPARESSPDYPAFAAGSSLANDNGPADHVAARSTEPLPFHVTSATPVLVPTTTAPPPSASTSSTTITSSGQPEKTSDVVLKAAAYRDPTSIPKKPKASAYEETVTALILRACFEYEALISTHDAFPDSATRTKWALRCWTRAGRDAGESDYDISPPISTLIRNRGSRIRSHGIDITRQQVMTALGFE
ncbi:hypothetical protein CVT26_010396, partial [Gymnopilus dilepis]